MPIYEYRCTQCEHKLEALQRFSDAPLVTCPACGKEALTKLVSAAGFQLKGSGWYATDFRSSGSKKPDGKKPEGDKADGDKPASEAKPEAAKSDAPATTSDTTPAAPAPSTTTTKAA